MSRWLIGGVAAIVLLVVAWVVFSFMSGGVSESDTGAQSRDFSSRPARISRVMAAATGISRRRQKLANGSAPLP